MLVLSSIQSLTRITKLFLDLDITVDGRCENIFELSRYDELPDLEDYHPSDTKNSLTLLRKNGLDKRKDDLPIPVTKCNENIQKGQTFSFQGEHHWKSIDIPRITKDIPKKLTSKYLMAKSLL